MSRADVILAFPGDSRSPVERHINVLSAAFISLGRDPRGIAEFTRRVLVICGYIKEDGTAIHDYSGWTP